MNRIWLKNYPQACRPRSIRTSSSPSRTCSTNSSASSPPSRPITTSATRSAMPNWSGCRATSPPSCRDCRAWPGASASRSCRRTCCSTRWSLFGILRAGMTVVNVNPLYTPRELEHQLKDSGAKAIVILENFAHTLQQVLGKTPVEHVITTQVGDMLPVPKRWLVNFVIKHVKKMVPAWRIDGAITLREALARGAAATLQAGRRDARRHRLPAVHRRHHRRRQGRDAHPPQHPRQPGADRRLDLGQLQGRQPKSSSRRCRCTTSSA